METKISQCHQFFLFQVIFSHFHRLTLCIYCHFRLKICLYFACDSTLFWICYNVCPTIQMMCKWSAKYHKILCIFGSTHSSLLVVFSLLVHICQWKNEHTFAVCPLFLIYHGSIELRNTFCICSTPPPCFLFYFFFLPLWCAPNWKSEASV